MNGLAGIGGSTTSCDGAMLRICERWRGLLISNSFGTGQVLIKGRSGSPLHIPAHAVSASGECQSASMIGPLNHSLLL